MFVGRSEIFLPFSLVFSCFIFFPFPSFLWGVGGGNNSQLIGLVVFTISLYKLDEQ